MSASGRRRWAEKAEELNFTQLDHLRALAERWRNGLAGLTALLAAVSVIKGRENLAEMTPAGRGWTVTLLMVSFFALLSGTVIAMRASFGLPGAPIWLTGPEVEKAENEEAPRIRSAIDNAIILSVLGVTLAAGATLITWLNKPASPVGYVIVDTGGEDPVCGELQSSDASGLTVKSTNGVEQETEVAVPYDDIEALGLKKEC